MASTCEQAEEGLKVNFFRSKLDLVRQNSIAFKCGSVISLISFRAFIERTRNLAQIYYICGRTFSWEYVKSLRIEESCCSFIFFKAA